MNQTTLLELYLKKDPRAIEVSLAAHGYIMRRVAMNMLAGEAEAEAALEALEALEDLVLILRLPQ